MTTEEDTSNQALSSRYHSVIIDGNQEEQDGHAVRHPLELLREIWRVPSIAPSIKYIIFVNSDTYNFESSQVDDSVKALIREFESANGQR